MLNLRCDARDALYKRSLHTIGDKKFTKRQIDIIACITHMRGDSEIAKILDLSVRTVGAHVYSLYRRFDNVNSRDGIINFIEKSGAIIDIKLYYFYLLVTKEFQAKLLKIKRISNGQKIFYKLHNLNNTESFLMIKHIIHDLKLANIILSESEDTYADVNLFINDFHEEVVSGKGYPKKNILLVFYQEKPRQEYKNIIAQVHFGEDDNYYFSLFELIQNISPYPGIKPMFEKFKSIVSNLEQIIERKPVIYEPTKNDTKIKEYVFYSLAIAITVVILIFYSAHFYINNFFNTSAESVSQKISNINNEMLQLVEEKKDSQNNINKNNAPYMYQIEALNSAIDKIGLEYYQRLSLKEFLVYLHANYSLANYYTYHLHDAPKALNLLFFLKSKIEGYLESKDKRFKVLRVDENDSEIIHELHKYEHLPEIYARILYSLGRSYFYNGIVQVEAIRYLKLSHKLSSIKGLFEEHLSIANGLLWIDIDNAEIDIKEGRIKEAETKLEKIIAEYDKLLNTDKKYIVDYNHKGDHRGIISPSQPGERSRAVCLQKKVKCYRLLMQIAPSAEHFSKALSSIIQIQLEDKTLDVRRTAVILNSIGMLLLEAKQQGITSLPEEQKQSFLNWVASSEKLAGKIIFSYDLLELAKNVFTLALEFSAQWDHSKAIAHEGLYKILSKFDIEKAMEHKYKANIINNKLGKDEIE